MTQEELSAQEAAIDRAIGLLKRVDEIDEDKGLDVYALVDASRAWSALASAVTAHNRSVVATVLAEAAVAFVQSPDPDAYARLGAAVEQYLAER